MNNFCLYNQPINEVDICAAGCYFGMVVEREREREDQRVTYFR
jgi:hypothetical protein